MSTRKTATLAAALYPAAVLALTAVHVLWPQRSGLLALSQIVAPYLFLGTAVFVPFALLAGARVLRVLLVVVLLVGVLRFGEEVVSLGGPIYGAADAITALSWNLEAGDVRDEQLSTVLRSTNASIVALQELTPGHASVLETDPELRVRFPHRMLVARSGVLGIGLLSAYPIRAQELRSTPGQLVTLELHGTPLRVLNAHPLPGTIRTATPLRLPYDFDPSRRDADITALRAWIEPAISRRDPILVLGDYNVTDREPAYRTLATGLRDAHLAVGNGSGASWRPERFKELPIALLRIDYLLSAGGVTPLTVSTDCTPRGGDHCILTGSFAIGEVEPPARPATPS
jgi:endonuclease/exonuclease/phosphatase family metal-dependent hydrolase